MKKHRTDSSSFLPVDDIREALSRSGSPDGKQVDDIINKSLGKQRLDPDEVAVLLRVTDPQQLEKIFEGARNLKEMVYGNRIVLFAPLYVGNECVNGCRYCGFRSDNQELARHTLSSNDLELEISSLIEKGHKRLIMVFGEHPRYNADFIHDSVKQVYANKKNHGEIRRVNINAAPMDVEGFRRVKEAEIGTYQIFQETYDPEVYAQVHPFGPKANYSWRLEALDRAMEAGIDDVGIGALMGLGDWKFEVMGLLHHTIHLEDRFGVGPHTISFPRIEPAPATEFCENPPNEVSDDDFKKLVAILRLAVPYTGLILTCRESSSLRDEVLRFGVSQIDAGSSIGIGSYSGDSQDSKPDHQFELNDNRSLDEVSRSLCESGYIPSFCTACYRKNRTGEHFMEFAVPGFVKRFCTPNAVLTFLEYLEDYASEETRQAGLACIEAELKKMGPSKGRQQVEEKMAKIIQGQRDLYY